MIGSKDLVILTVVLAVGAVCFHPIAPRAADDAPTASDPAGASEAPAPRSPLRVNSFDYEDNGDQAGKLKLAGIALPGNELYLYFDDQPLAKVVPDSDGKWSLESEVKLEDGRHTLRAEQFDPVTNMLAARAMLSIERAKQPPDGAPKAATP
jgi:hypothetical protein